jgi:NADPH-dependent 2,4-dienoyl-CoA reductase/sulfur reductase-like enzyme
MINEHIREHHIDLRLETNLVEILADGEGKAKAVVTDKGETIPCEFVGLTPGVTPNIDFLKGSKIELGKGVLVNRFLETNIPGVYAIGDCAEQREPIGNRKPVEAVWYTGRMMGEVVAQTVCGNRMEYKPGHWFNSAKFLDIEYQTYGWVYSTEGKKEYEAHFHWRHPVEKCCITLSYHKDSRQFLGINTFGIRMRHEVIDRWLSEGRKVEYVMEFLKDANFDPEFYTAYETAIVAKFNSESGTAITPRKKSWKRIFNYA